MKLVKRSNEPEETPSGGPQDSAGGKKPVVVYIIILFLVAFILIAFSFAMHQRSNTKEIGKLQHSVSALQEVQAAQDKNMKLQEQLDELQAENEKLQKELTDTTSSADSAAGRADALEALYTLMQQYATADYSGCKATIASMEGAGLDKLLPAETDSGVTSPAQRYLQLRQAVESK